MHCDKAFASLRGPTGFAMNPTLKSDSKMVVERSTNLVLCEQRTTTDGGRFCFVAICCTNLDMSVELPSFEMITSHF